MVKSGNNEKFHKTAFELKENNCAKKIVGICNCNLKKNLKKRSAEGRNRTHRFGLGSHVLTSIPPNCYNLTLSERPFRSSVCKFVSTMAKICAKTEALNSSSLAWVSVVVTFVAMKTYLVTRSKRTFQRNHEHVGKSGIAVFIVTFHFFRFI